MIHADRLPGGGVTNGDVGVVSTGEGVEIVCTWVTQMVLHVFNGGQSRTFGKEFIGGPRVVSPIVDPWGWWIGGCFCTRHGLMKKAEEGGKEKGLANGVKAERGREILEKPYPHEKRRTGGNDEGSRTQKYRKYKRSQAVIRAIQ